MPAIEWKAWMPNWAVWPERLASMAVLLSAIVLTALSVTYWPFWVSALVWPGFAIVAAVLSKLGWIKLLGPVLFYDMIRTGRRSRYAAMRLAYAFVLVCMLAYMFLMIWSQNMLAARFNPGARGLTARDLAVVAEWFFAGFVIVQLIMVVLLTPAYVAGAIADEKDRKTMEFLLATDLRNREIVLSKFLSRLANLTLLLLVGLPILSILQLLGGVDPELMIAGFIGVGLTMLGIAAISILLSTLFRKPRDSISLTYLMLVAYFVLATTMYGMSSAGHPWMQWPLWFGDNPPRMRDASNVVNAGNPLTAIIDIGSAISGQMFGGRRSNLATELPRILQRYAWFHLTVTTVCVVWSISRLRPIALKQTPAGTSEKLRWWQRLRPAVGNFPMLWKEIFIEGRVRLNWLLWLAVLVLVLLTIGSGLYIIGYYLHTRFVDGFDPGLRMLQEGMNWWFRIAGTFVACLLLLMVGVRASTSITTERERDTFDALVTTPMSSDGMLASKLIGNVLGMRIGWIWFAVMLAMGVVTGGVHPLSVPLIVIACAVYALVMTILGLTFSAVCRSSLASTVWTVMTSIFLGGGHWMLTWCICTPMAMLITVAIGFGGANMQLMEALGKIAEYWVKFQCGMTPPIAIGMFTFSWDQFKLNHFGDRWYWETVGFSILGLFLWILACGILWFSILSPAFRRATRRIELETE